MPRYESVPNTKENTPTKVELPPLTSLFNGTNVDSSWPKEIIENIDLRKQASERQQLYLSLDNIFSKVEDVDLDIHEALRNRLLTEKEVLELYERLQSYLKEDPANKRLLLYFPFELIPSAYEQFDGETMERTSKEFVASYKQKWIELLHQHDVRANFVDGDLTETQIDRGDIPLVSKAAHLIPVLVQKGIVTVNEMIDTIENNTDEILRNSIAGAFSVLSDLDLISRDTLDRMYASQDPLVHNLVAILNAERNESFAMTNQTTPVPEKIDRETLFNQINDEIDEINKRKQSSDISEDRFNWEKRRDTDYLIEMSSDVLSKQIETGNATPENIQELSSRENNICGRIAAETIKKHIQSLAKKDITAARAQYNTFEPIILDLWKKREPAVADQIESMWSHLLSAKVIDEQYITEHGATLPSLDSDISFEESDIAAQAAEISNALRSNEILSKFILPANILYGSKIKKYGVRIADNDVAVFIRPDTDPEERTNIKAEIDKTLSEKGLGNKALEFWLEESDGKLKIKDLPYYEKYIGDSALVSTLFGGMWSGEKETIKDLYAHLLSEYLKVHNTAKRSEWLHEMERGTLQFRLMHRGYNRFHPKQKSIETAHSSLIDSDSTFWDPGYRRLATKIYIKKVFLPKI